MRVITEVYRLVGQTRSILYLVSAMRKGHRDVLDFIFKKLPPKSAKKRKIKSCGEAGHDTPA